MTTKPTRFDSDLNSLRDSLISVGKAIRMLQRSHELHGRSSEVYQILLDYLPGNGNAETEAFAKHLVTTIMRPGP